MNSPTITDDFAGYLVSGISITVATRNGALRPNGARAWAAVLDDDREHMTLFVCDKAARPLLEDLQSHPEIAAAFDRPTDSRACQIKGLYVSSRRARPAEREEVGRQRDGFLRELELLGIPRAMTEGWRFWPSVAIRFRITHLFEQTPGPGAGEPIR